MIRPMHPNFLAHFFKLNGQLDPANGFSFFFPNESQMATLDSILISNTNLYMRACNELLRLFIQNVLLIAP
jgi:hypothetical protein